LSRQWERRANRYLKKRRGTFDRPRDLLKDLKNLAWKYIGPVAIIVKEGLELLASRVRIEKVYPATVNDLFRKGTENVLLIRRLEGQSAPNREQGASAARISNQDDQNWLRTPAV
jgi:hypothetical protein